MRLLACHDNSYLRTLAVDVLECLLDDDGYRARLSASIFYPGGGGQPADIGYLNGVKILGVSKDDPLVLILDHEVCKGPGILEIDWERRFDHMQQHTGQHLLSGLALTLFGWQTTAFHLNHDRCDIVVNSCRTSEDEIGELEKRVNENIRAARDVTSCEMNISEIEASSVRCGRLPKGQIDTLRVMSIEGVDANPCGGTHVKNTSELQALSILGFDVKGNETRIHFVVGQRVLTQMRALIRNQDQMSRLLSRGPAEHLEAIARFQEKDKNHGRLIRSLQNELGIRLGQMHVVKNAGRPMDGPVVIHQSDGDLTMLEAFARTIEEADEEVLVIATAGEKASGIFLCAGPVEKLQSNQSRILEILEGRGGIRGRRFQGKAARPKNVKLLLS